LLSLSPMACPFINASLAFWPGSAPSACSANGRFPNLPCVQASFAQLSIGNDCMLWVYPGCYDLFESDYSETACDVHPGSLIQFEDSCDKYGCGSSGGQASELTGINRRLTGTWVVGPTGEYGGHGSGVSTFWIQRHDRQPHNLTDRDLEPRFGADSSGRWSCETTNPEGGGYGYEFCPPQNSPSADVRVGVAVGVAASVALLCCAVAVARRRRRAAAPTIKRSAATAEPAEQSELQPEHVVVQQLEASAAGTPPTEDAPPPPYTAAMEAPLVTVTGVEVLPDDTDDTVRSAPVVVGANVV